MHMHLQPMDRDMHPGPRYQTGMPTTMGCVLLLCLTCGAALQPTMPLRASMQPRASVRAPEMDEINVVGKTAFTANACRVLSERNLSHPLYYDAFGHVFLNSWSQNHIQELSNTFPEFVYEMPLRTAFYDAQVRQATARGIAQIVIIGSGLDCRPLRLHDPAVQFFEFDQAALLDYKLAKLQTLAIPKYPSKMIRGDYLELDMKEELLKVGFNGKKPALFLWEGNSMYIPTERSHKLLRSLVNDFPHAQLAFDFVTSAISGARPATDETQWFYDLTSFIVSDVGVAPTWHAHDLHTLCEEVPFQVQECWSIWELSGRFRDEQALTEMYGSRARFEATQGWMKHYMHLLVGWNAKVDEAWNAQSSA